MPVLHRPGEDRFQTVLPAAPPACAPAARLAVMALGALGIEYLDTDDDPREEAKK